MAKAATCPSGPVSGQTFDEGGNLASRGRGCRSLYARAAAHMLGLHGLLSLAFETQTIEKDASTITLNSMEAQA